MITLADMKALAADCEFKDWTIRVSAKDDQPFLQVQFPDKDRISGQVSIQKCRKFSLSYHMVPSEVVRTAFKAIEMAMLHEVQEEFRFRKVRIFNPHFDLIRMAEIANQFKVSVRDETNYTPTDVK